MTGGWYYFIKHNRPEGAHSIKIVGMGEIREFNKNWKEKHVCYTLMSFVFSPRRLKIGLQNGVGTSEMRFVTA